MEINNWQLLLDLLDAGRGDPGRSYERARRLLADYFLGRGEAAHSVDELVDATFDRVAAALPTRVPVRNVDAYVKAFARFISLEGAKRGRYRHRREELLKASAAEEALQQLRKILIGDEVYDELLEQARSLTGTDVDLVATYYSGRLGTNGNGREELARRLGVSMGLLRTMVSRARKRLRERLTASAA